MVVREHTTNRKSRSVDSSWLAFGGREYQRWATMPALREPGGGVVFPNVRFTIREKSKCGETLPTNFFLPKRTTPHKPSIECDDLQEDDRNSCAGQVRTK